MELLERKRLFEFLGRDFLVWLWFKSETNGGKFDLNEIGLIDLSLDNKIILQSESTVYEEKQLEKLLRVQISNLYKKIHKGENIPILKTGANMYEVVTKD